MNSPSNDPYVLATHLQMIHGIITRLAQNSFLLKGWSVTLIVALFAFAGKDKDAGVAYLALIPAIAFWMLDAYYLWQERMFRDLYKVVADGKLPGSYSMALTGGITSQQFIGALFSVTEAGFHGPLLTVVAILIRTWG
jgi:hypothetical protein